MCYTPRALAGGLGAVSPDHGLWSRYKYRGLSLKGDTLNWVDAVILAMVAWFVYSAFNAGLIREVITILGAIFAVVLAGIFYKELAKDVDVAVNKIETSRIIALA